MSKDFRTTFSNMVKRKLSTTSQNKAINNSPIHASKKACIRLQVPNDEENSINSKSPENQSRKNFKLELNNDFSPIKKSNSFENKSECNEEAQKLNSEDKQLPNDTVKDLKSVQDEQRKSVLREEDSKEN